MRVRPVLLVALVWGCSPSATSGNGGSDPFKDSKNILDAGSMTTGNPDAAVPDAGGSVSPDAGGIATPDAGSADASMPDAGPTAVKFATGVQIRHVAAFQAVKIPLVEDTVVASLPRNAPLVSGRDALVRVYVEGAGTIPRAELEVSAGSARQVLTASDGPESAVDVPGLRAVSFLVPATLVQPQARYAVRLLDPVGGAPAAGSASHPARFPADGSDAPLQSQPDPGALKITLVPMQYDRDGSGRLPDTSPAQLDRMRALLGAVYPTTDVQLTVREPVSWTRSLTLWGNVNFSALNNTLADLRVDDGAADDVYYYGLISAADTFDDYCGGSCVTGQSWVVDDATDADIRVGAGMGFSGDDSIWTLIHELGHMHGRYHAPCDVDDWDEDYPYDGASIGDWGYDVVSGQLLDPELATDFMGYCENNWLSDYTWSALYERVAALNNVVTQKPRARVPTLPIHIDSHGGVAAGTVVRMKTGTGAPGPVVQLLGTDGAVLDTVQAQVVHDGHGGVTLLLPRPADGVASVQFTLGGTLRQVGLTSP